MAHWGYVLVHGVHVTRIKGTAMDVATPDGWKRCSSPLRWLFEQSGKKGGRYKDLTSRNAQRRLVRACCTLTVDADRVDGTCRLLPWLISPPLGSGASRFLSVNATDAATASYSQALDTTIDETLMANAAAGYERARERRDGISARASFFLQAAGVTGTLVLANGALLVGDDPGVGTPAKIIITVGLLVASCALIAAGVYGLFAITRTFSQISPNSPRRLIARSQLPANAARRRATASLLLAQRRASIIGDWKLDRVKRATLAFLVGVAGVAIATIALVAEALIA